MSGAAIDAGKMQIVADKLKINQLEKLRFVICTTIQHLSPRQSVGSVTIKQSKRTLN
jgi:hypothetical protein